ncbi:hypothetical protein MIR68_002649 [Amoeboaphelidium protococcarum]|nr:hypothetical protein MIR68_002649 [Amoeboaphelidium protococcarum]
MRTRATSKQAISIKIANSSILPDVPVLQSEGRKRTVPTTSDVPAFGDQTELKLAKSSIPQQKQSESDNISNDGQTIDLKAYPNIRLGYACLNTVLRESDPAVFCSRTLRLKTLLEKGLDYAKDLGYQNACDLIKLIEWNERHQIRLMRISSEMFPFASHQVHGYSVKCAEVPLRQAGDLAKKYGHRLTLHPGQFSQLGSPNEDVIKRSLLDLEYQSELLDLTGHSAQDGGVMVIHMGGVYGDKQAAYERFKINFKRLSANAQNRLVLENDELCYSVQDLLPLCEELQIPLVLDWHHHSLNPLYEHIDEFKKDDYHLVEQSLLDRINAIWKSRGIRIKQHYSESRPGAKSIPERRAHSDYVRRLPPLPQDLEVDIMIEAKMKEQAVLQLYKQYDYCKVEDLKNEQIPDKVDENQDITSKGELCVNDTCCTEEKEFVDEEQIVTKAKKRRTNSKKQK